jgi:hypothetical protein
MHGPYPYTGPRRGADLKVGARRQPRREVLERYPLNEIRLTLRDGSWHATYVGPHARRVVETFGAATIPTPYLAGINVETMLGELRQRNPGVIVKVWGIDAGEGSGIYALQPEDEIIG